MKIRDNKSGEVFEYGTNGQFFREPQHKRTLEQLRQLLGKVRKVEKYHENRYYIPRLNEDQ